MKTNINFLGSFWLDTRLSLFECSMLQHKSLFSSTKYAGTHLKCHRMQIYSTEHRHVATYSNICQGMNIQHHITIYTSICQLTNIFQCVPTYSYINLCRNTNVRQSISVYTNITICANLFQLTGGPSQDLTCKSLGDNDQKNLVRLIALYCAQIKMITFVNGWYDKHVQMFAKDLNRYNLKLRLTKCKSKCQK